MQKACLLVVLVLLGIAAWFSAARAQSLDLFDAIAATMPSGHSQAIIWRSSSGVKSVDFQFSDGCKRGIVIYYENGAETNCDSSVNLSPSGSQNFVIYNYTSGTVTLTVKMTPKDLDNVAIISAAQTDSFSVSAATEAFGQFTVTPARVKSGTMATMDWGAKKGIDGVNIYLECGVSNVIMSVGGALVDPYLKRCGEYFFNSERPTIAYPAAFSSSAVFKNTGTEDEIIKLVAVPFMDGIYEAAFSKKIEVTVEPEKLVDVAPKITSFTSSVNPTESEKEILLSWAGANISGVNFLISDCASDVSYKIGSGNYQNCVSGYVFSAPLFDTGTQLITFKSANRASVKIIAVPYYSGIYDLLLSKTINLSVMPKTVTLSIPAPATTSSSAYKFSKNLYYGIRGSSDVIKLQEALIKSGVYSGPVSGNFFSLTQAAVKKFQAKYGVSTTGYVGPLTRAKLNSL